MSAQKINSILILLSLIIVSYYIAMVVQSICTSQQIDIMNLNSLFGAIIVASIFIISNLTSSNLKTIKLHKVIFRMLLIIAVVFSGVLLNEILKGGFFKGADTFWGITTILLALSSMVLIQFSQQKWLKPNK